MERGGFFSANMIYLFIYGLFNESVSSFNCAASNEWMIRQQYGGRGMAEGSLGQI
jgi:hypothetical protein